MFYINQAYQDYAPLHHHRYIIGRLVVYQQVTVPIIHYPTARVLCLVQKSVAICILFIILTHNLQGKKTYQVNQHNNDYRCTDYIFPLLQIIISFHYFFLLIASAHNIQMTVIEASVNIFNNKTGRLKNEKVSMTSKMVQNKKVHNKIYRKKGENPILLIPGSKSSTLSRSVTNLK